MSKIYNILLLCLAASSCVAVANDGDLALISYSYKGGHSPYSRLEVTVHRSGKTEVNIQKYSDPSISYTTGLSELELESLETLIRSSDFSILPVDNKLSFHSGETTITVSRASTADTVVFVHEPTMKPLSMYFGRLIVQAEALNAIQTDGDIYTATGAVIGSHAGAKALQPDKFREPMISYVRRSSDPQRIGWVMQALAWILTTDELIGLISSEFNKPDRQPLILYSMPGNSPKVHPEAFCPLYLSYIRENLPRRRDLTPIQNNTFDNYLQALGNARYEPAIPLMITLFDKATQESLHADVIPLSQMGLAGLNAILPYLASKNQTHRSYALELFQIAARGNPKSTYSNRYSSPDYEKMIPFFKNQVILKIQEVAEKDPSPDLRVKAAEALAEITMEISR